MTFRKKIFLCIWLLLLLAVGWVYFGPSFSFATGRPVPAERHPYFHLTYVKLSPDHRGNFTGDLYLLNWADRDIERLTRGGITGSASWLDSNRLYVTRRPKGSVVDPFLLDASTGRLSRAEPYAQYITFYEELYGSLYSSDRTYAVVELQRQDSLSNQSFAILRVADEAAEPLIVIETDWSGRPQWMLNNDFLVYGRSDNQLCLLDVDKLSQECIAGVHPVLAPSVRADIGRLYDLYYVSAGDLCGRNRGGRFWAVPLF